MGNLGNYNPSKYQQDLTLCHKFLIHLLILQIRHFLNYLHQYKNPKQKQIYGPEYLHFAFQLIHQYIYLLSFPFLLNIIIKIFLSYK